MSDPIPREVLDTFDAEALRNLLGTDPERATVELGPWSDHPGGAQPLNYVAMLRYDTRGGGTWREVRGTGELARLLIDAGAPIDGRPEESETPLITAASYGDAEVADVLVGAGADLERLSAPDAGGVPSATALMHATVFSTTPVVDLLVAAGARIGSLSEAAAAGDISGWDLSGVEPIVLLRALIVAAGHGRLSVIDALLDAGVPIDGLDEEYGGQPLCEAASAGRVESVRHLLDRGADPDGRDGGGNSASRCASGHADDSNHGEIQELLAKGRG